MASVAHASAALTLEFYARPMNGDDGGPRRSLAWSGPGTRERTVNYCSRGTSRPSAPATLQTRRLGSSLRGAPAIFGFVDRAAQAALHAFQLEKPYMATPGRAFRPACPEVLRWMFALLGAEPSPWTWGWDALVAIGTLTLAIVTAALALVTRGMAAKTSDLARETAEDVRAGARPVLLDPADGPRSKLWVSTDGRDGALRTVVRNAGPGPALNVSAYVRSATRAATALTLPQVVGNVAPGATAELEVRDVPTRDASGSMDSYLFFRLVLVYADVSGRTYHTAIRLTEPHGGRVVSSESGAPREDPLTAHGTEVGDGDAPSQQWVVSFKGAPLSDEHRARLDTGSILLLGGRGEPMTSAGPGPPPEPSSWTYDAVTSGERSADAIEHVRATIGEGAPDVGWQAKPWLHGPLPTSVTRER